MQLAADHLFDAKEKARRSGAKESTDEGRGDV
jgi:hypothetical protein